MAGLAVALTADGRGPFLSGVPDTSLMLSLTFVAAAAVSALVLAALTAERRRAQECAERARDEMEERVRERTAELEARERQLAEAQALAHLGSWSWDLPTRALSCSDELQRILGWGGDVSGTTLQAFRDAVHLDDRRVFADAIALTEATGEPFALDIRIVRPDGALRWIHARGEAVIGACGPVALRGTVGDISERKRVEAALAESEERFRHAFEMAPIGMCLTDLEGRFLRVNAEYSRMTGHTAEDLARMSFWDLTDPEHRDENRRRFVPMAMGSTNGFRMEKRYRTKDRRTALVTINSSVVRDGDGEPLYVVAQVQDVTERKDMERLKDEFIATVSHELGTPLASIIAHLEGLNGAELGPLNDEQRNFLAVIDRNAGRLSKLVDDLLFVAQADAGRIGFRPGVVDLRQIVRDAVETVRPVASKRGILVAVDAREIPPLDADRARLAELLDHLLSNAVKFTPDPGRVEIRVFRERDVAVLEVADRGVGIPEHELGRIFERFFRASSALTSSIRGTGLGLAIVKAIVDLHGGRIEVDSREGVGTTFRVELPLERAVNDPARPAGPGHRVRPGPTPRSGVLARDGDQDRWPFGPRGPTARA